MSKRNRAESRLSPENRKRSLWSFPRERAGVRCGSLGLLWETLEPRMFLSNSPLAAPSPAKYSPMSMGSWEGAQWLAAGDESHLSTSAKGHPEYAMLDSSLQPVPVMDQRLVRKPNAQPVLGTNDQSQPTNLRSIAQYTIFPPTFTMVDTVVQNDRPAPDYIAVMTGLSLPYGPPPSDGTNFAGLIARGASAIGNRGTFDTRAIAPPAPPPIVVPFSRASTQDQITVDLGDSLTSQSLLNMDLGVTHINTLTTYVGENQPDTSYLITTMPSSRPRIDTLTPSAAVVEAGTTLTLVASGVTDTLGSITAVTFYLETGNVADGNAGAAVEIGVGVQSGATWTISTSTDGFPPGVFTYTAVATDNTGAKSAVKTTTVTVARPVIESLAINPAVTTVGTSVTLTAENVEQPVGTIANVAFYLENKGISGLPTADDVFLGRGIKSGGTWKLNTPAAQIAPGRYRYYAIATDAGGNVSRSAARLLTVVVGHQIFIVQDNDNFTNAAVVSGTNFTALASNADASREPGEALIAPRAGGRSVWYTWTAPSTAKIALDTNGSSFDTLLGVYTGPSVSQLTKVASNDDAGPGRLTSALSFQAHAGTSYYFCVDGYRGASGSVMLNLSHTHDGADASLAAGTPSANSPSHDYR